MQPPCDATSPLPGICPMAGEAGTQAHCHTPVPWAAAVSAAERRECPVTDEWLSKMWSLRTQEHFSAVKCERKVLAPAPMGMHLEGWWKPVTKWQMLYESTSRSNLGQASAWSQNAQRCPGAGGKRAGVSVRWGQSFTLGWWKVLETDGGEACPTPWMHLKPPNCNLKVGKMVNVIYYI